LTQNHHAYLLRDVNTRLAELDVEKSDGKYRLPWLTPSNWVFLAFTLAAAVSAIAVFLLSQASEREKDRALERYKAGAEAQSAKSPKHMLAPNGRARMPPRRKPTQNGRSSKPLRSASNLHSRRSVSMTPIGYRH
jgi:hypothetical protein